jgi:hypothetical protein
MSRQLIPFYQVGIAFQRDTRIWRRVFYFLSEAERDTFIEQCKPYGGVAYKVRDKFITTPHRAMWAVQNCKLFNENARFFQSLSDGGATREETSHDPS